MQTDWSGSILTNDRWLCLVPPGGGHRYQDTYPRRPPPSGDRRGGVDRAPPHLFGEGFNGPPHPHTSRQEPAGYLGKPVPGPLNVRLDESSLLGKYRDCLVSISPRVCRDTGPPPRRVFVLPVMFPVSGESTCQLSPNASAGPCVPPPPAGAPLGFHARSAGSSPPPIPAPRLAVAPAANFLKWLAPSFPEWLVLNSRRWEGDQNEAPCIYG